MVIVQLLFTAAACLGLWRLCRNQPRIVLAGLLVRALVGQALFWVSYLRLPIARSLQLGNGFWFFAVDGPFYLRYAAQLVDRGPAAMLLDAKYYPSQFFVLVLSFFAGAFGSVASVAILLNCAAYLLTCTIIARVFKPRNDIVLAAIACSPAGILFSLQPLKDTLFTLLIVAMIAAFRRWEESWRSEFHWARILGYALAMLGLVFAIAGIRWYVSVIAWGASALFFVLASLQANRKGWAFVTGALLVVLLAQSIRFGAHDLQPAYARLLNPMTVLQWRPSATQEHLATVKRGFESTPGATTVAEGGALAQLATSSPVPEATETVAPEPEPPPTTTHETATVAPRVHVAPPPTLPDTTTVAETLTETVAPAPAPPPVVAPITTTTATETVVPAPPETTTVAPVVPVSEKPHWISLPRWTTRIITGFAVMFLPRFVGESLGLIRVGGGRGLWLFAETDTILFDLVLLYALVYCVRSVRRGRAKLTATFVFTLLVFVMTAGPMLYTVNNFGTLFRLRLMVYVTAAMLPVTLRSVTPRDESDAVQ